MWLISLIEGKPIIHKLLVPLCLDSMNRLELEIMTFEQEFAIEIPDYKRTFYADVAKNVHKTREV